jgi:hypothetical protein
MWRSPAPGSYHSYHSAGHCTILEEKNKRQEWRRYEAKRGVDRTPRSVTLATATVSDWTLPRGFNPFTAAQTLALAEWFASDKFGLVRQQNEGHRMIEDPMPPSPSARHSHRALEGMEVGVSPMRSANNSERWASSAVTPVTFVRLEQTPGFAILAEASR